MLRTKCLFVTSLQLRSEHPIMDANGHKNQYKYGHVPDHKEGFGGDKIGEEGAGDGVDLVAGADEDEGGEEDVDHRVVGNHHQHAVGIGTEPDVVLGDEQLQVQSAKPGEETERKQDQMNSWICSATLNICS